jgi:hypothetical protein
VRAMPHLPGYAESSTAFNCVNICRDTNRPFQAPSMIW